MSDDTLHVFDGGWGIRGDPHNWILCRFVADDEKAPPVAGKAPKVGADVLDGRTGVWQDRGYYGRLDGLVVALRDALVRDGFGSPDLVDVVLGSTKYLKSLVEKLAVDLGRSSI